MKIAVTGKNGQVVQSLLARADEGFEIIALGRPELDLAMPETIFSALAAVQPDFVISAAAYTAVDKAEDEPDLAYLINANGAEAVSDAAAKLNVPIIHISTDYVFDGSKSSPYLEEDLTNPKNIYGSSKLKGEQLVAAANPKHIIIRTSWVYSPYGINFLKTMLRLAGTHKEISVVSDQWGAPTSAIELATAIKHVVECISRDAAFNSWGIYNFSGAGVTNWADFAREIFKHSSKLRNSSVNVIDIMTSDYHSKACRPKNSKISTDKFENEFKYTIPNWKVSLKEVLNVYDL